jgi:signal peptidase II
MKLSGPCSRLGLGIAAAVLFLDQLHKWWMIDIFRIGEKGKVTVTPFFDLVMVWNEGISYGLFKQGSVHGQYALAAFAIAASVALALWMAQFAERLPAIATGLIIGGALGNAMDRLAYGAVADFFSFHAFGFYWYVFNIADMAIVAGVCGLLYDSLKPGHKKAGNET